MKKLSIIVIFLMFCTYVFSQEKEYYFSPEVNVSYVIGGKISQETIVLRSGLNADFSLLTTLNSEHKIGGGIGIVNLEDELFIPVFANFKGTFSEDAPTWYYSIKLGYPYAHNRKFNSYKNYSFIGLAYFEPGIGYQINISEDVKFNAGFKLIGQIAKLSYVDSQNSIDYDELLPFALIGFNFGLEF